MSVPPSDPRFPELVTGFNRRWVAAPDAVRLVTTTAQVALAVQEAVLARKKVSVRSGGHCYANFVYNDEAKLIVDLSLMNQIYYDPLRCAFAVESGAQLGRVYETLFRGWGVTLPGGVCPTVAVGGHAAGGGHGLLSRQLGNICDLVEAVEVVVVDRGGLVRVVTASRNPADPNHDLWWACTGGGGGNFGVVTRYWFRTRGASGTDPRGQLPRPPKDFLVSQLFIPWQNLNRDQFVALVRNHGTWHERNSSPTSPGAALCGLMFAPHVSGGGIAMLTTIDADLPDADGVVSDYWSTVTAGTGVGAAVPRRRLPWMAATETINTSNAVVMTDATNRNSVKSAYLRRGFTEEQIRRLHHHLTRTDYANPNAIVQLGAMAGGRINALLPTDTAVVARTSALFTFFQAYWRDQADDAANLAWLRDVYRDVFADTGGYPVPGDRYGGCSINAPDLEITDPAVNTSGVPWSTLYYGENYPRLQRAKAAYDPTDFFRHALSVRLP
ncbi:FAD-binding protein [Saccharothrix syringae]|uniref:FAD-binding protein n=1 Tax=Saccharothrix syringae TaxID=103733 RepID=A0A5Q0HD87_SACSY|nr:FAD-binding protein [Saccharothrix syringae]